MAGVAQGLGPEGIKHGGQLAQRRPRHIGVVVVFAHKVHRAHFHGEVVFAQHMVQHDEGHVPRVLGKFSGDVAGKAQFQRGLAVVGLQGHQHIGGGQLKAIHANGEVRLGGAGAEGHHAVVLQLGGGVHQLREQRKLLDAAVRGDDEVHHGVLRVALQLQGQALHMRLQQGVGLLYPLDQGLRVQCSLLRGKVSPESGDGGGSGVHAGVR